MLAGGDRPQLDGVTVVVARTLPSGTERYRLGKTHVPEATATRNREGLAVRTAREVINAIACVDDSDGVTGGYVLHPDGLVAAAPTSSTSSGQPADVVTPQGQKPAALRGMSVSVNRLRGWRRIEDQ